MGHAAGRLVGCHEDQVYRTGYVGVRRHVHESAFSHERCAERGEGARLDGGVPRQVLLQHCSVGPERLCQASRTNPRRELADRAELLAVAAVDEHEGGPLRVPEDERSELLAGDPVSRAGTLAPGSLGDRRDGREAPLFVSRGRKAGSGKPLHGSPTDRLQPVGVSAVAVAGQGLEFLQVGLAHDAAPTSCSSHSYPLASSSRARSLPPDFTIRPADSTCTWSGTM